MIEIILLTVAVPALALAIRRAMWRRRQGLHGESARARDRLRRGGTELVDGATVTLTGTARSVGEHVEAPLSGRDVIAFKARADLRTLGRDRRPKGFVAEHIRSSTRPFVLETGTGTILIDARDAVVELETTPLIPRQLDRESAFVQLSTLSAPGVVGTDFREVVLVDGDRVSVAGVVVVSREQVSGREYGYRDEPVVARLTSHERWPLTIGRAR